MSNSAEINAVVFDFLHDLRRVEVQLILKSPSELACSVEVISKRSSIKDISTPHTSKVHARAPNYH